MMTQPSLWLHLAAAILFITALVHPVTAYSSPILANNPRHEPLKLTRSTSTSYNVTFISPLSQTVVELGGLLNVTWQTNSTTDDTADLQLILLDQYSGISEKTVLSIATVDISSSTYPWSVPSSLSPGSYRLQLASSRSSTFLLMSVDTSNPSSPSATSRPGLSPEEKGGIIAGTVIGTLVILIIVGLWWYPLYQKRKTAGTTKDTERDGDGTGANTASVSPTAVVAQKENTVAPQQIPQPPSTAHSIPSTIPIPPADAPPEYTPSREHPNQGPTTTSPPQEEAQLTTDDKRRIMLQMNAAREAQIAAEASRSI